jgi:prepilin-type N-terminal cleavage/methylation domain-containing protein
MRNDKSNHKSRGFTAVELIGVIVIIVILALIATPTMFGDKGHANTVRSRDAAAALNAAEGNYYDYRYKTGPALTGVNVIMDAYTTNEVLRINNLTAGGYLESIVNPDDVQLDTTTAPPTWRPTYQ